MVHKDGSRLAIEQASDRQADLTAAVPIVVLEGLMWMGRDGTA